MSAGYRRSSRKRLPDRTNRSDIQRERRRYAIYEQDRQRHSRFSSSIDASISPYIIVFSPFMLTMLMYTTQILAYPCSGPSPAPSKPSGVARITKPDPRQFSTKQSQFRSFASDGILQEERAVDEGETISLSRLSFSQ
jgi:hypothetical protein